MSFRRTLLAATILTIVIAGLVWILNIQGVIKGSWSNPLSALFTILAVLFAFIQVAPQIFSVAISPDGQILVSKGFDRAVKVWNLYTGQLIHIYEELARHSSDLIISPDGENFAINTRDGIKVFNLSTGELLHTIALPSSTIFTTSITMSPDGQMLTNTTTDDDTIFIWNLRTGKLLHTLDGYSSRAYNVVISPDGQTLANCNEDGTINVWHWRTGRLLYTLKGLSPIDYRIIDLPEGHNISQYDIAFSPDGQSLVSMNKDRTITLWNQHTGQLLHTIKYHETIVSRIIFSSDGRTIAGGNEDGIKVWNLYTGELLRILKNYSLSIKSIAIGSNGSTLAIGNNDGTIKVYR